MRGGGERPCGDPTARTHARTNTHPSDLRPRSQPSSSLEPLLCRSTTGPLPPPQVIADSGLGLSEEDMVNNLGTIARSGSKAFVNEVGFRRAALVVGWVRTGVELVELE